METTTHFTFAVIILVYVSNYANLSLAQPQQGSSGSVVGAVQGSNNKGPLDDCRIINEGNVLKCQNWKNSGHGNRTGRLPTPPRLPGATTVTPPNNVTNPKWNLLHKLFSKNFPCDDNETLTESGNCTASHNVTMVTTPKVTTHVAMTTTSTTPLPTTTIDVSLVFDQLGVSTEEPAPTTSATTYELNVIFNETYYNLTRNETYYNWTHLFNITTEEAVNVTELVLELYPDLPANLLNASIEIETASYNKPAFTGFDRVTLTKCNGRPHPVAKLIHFLLKSQIISEYLKHICDSDYSDYCKKEWTDCKEDGIKLCPKTCKIAKCAGTKFFGYVAQDKPIFKLDPCEDDKRYKCNFLKARGDCLTGATSMFDICPNTCHFCKNDQKYLPWMPEYKKMLTWLSRYENGKYDKYAQVIWFEETVIHEKAVNNLC